MFENFLPNFSEKTKKRVALSVTAYFEDVISGFGLWQGFTRKHYQMYGKYLPFYQLTDDYIPEDINVEDVIFLVWSILQMEMRETKKIILDPENILIMSLGLKMFHVLEKEYETAPENEMLRDFFTESVNYEDFFNFRSTIAWFYYDSYLMKPYTDGILEEALKNIEKCKEYKDVVTYMITNELTLKNPCGPLALKTYEWFGAIVGEDTTLGKMLLRTQFKYKDPKTHLVTDVDDNGVTLLPFDSDDSIFLSKDVFSNGFPYKTGDAVLCNVIYYNRKWELNGFIINASVENYKKSREEAERKKNNVTHSIKLFLKANKNKPILYFRNGQEYEDFFTVAFNSSKKMEENPFKEHEDLVAFINAEEGVTVIADIALYIKDKNNPCYDKAIAKEYGLCILTEIKLFKGLIDYLLKNKCLPDLELNSLKGGKHGKNLIQDNLDFLFRFFQPKSYML